MLSENCVNGSRVVTLKIMLVEAGKKVAYLKRASDKPTSWRMLAA